MDIEKVEEQLKAALQNTILYAEDGSTPTGYIYQGKQVNLSEFKAELSALPKTGEEFHQLVKTDWCKAVEYFILYPKKVFDLLSRVHMELEHFAELLNIDIPISILYFKQNPDIVFLFSMQNIQHVLKNKNFFRTILTYAENMELDARAFNISLEGITSFQYPHYYPIYLRAIYIYFLGIITTKNSDKLSKFLKKVNINNLDQPSRLPIELKKLLATEWEKNREWLWEQSVFVYARLCITLFPEKHISAVPHRQAVFQSLLSQYNADNNPMGYVEFINDNFTEKTEQEALSACVFSTFSGTTRTTNKVKGELVERSESTIRISMLENLPTAFQKIACSFLLIDVMAAIKQKSVRLVPNDKENFIIQMVSLFMPETKELLQLGGMSINYNLDIYTQWVTHLCEKTKEAGFKSHSLVKEIPAERIAEKFRETLVNLIKRNIYSGENYPTTFHKLIPHFMVFVIGLLDERARAIILDKDKKTGTSILHLACAYGHTDLVKKIIADLRTNDPNSVKDAILEVDENKENALMHACGTPREGVIQILLAELGDQSERALFAMNKHSVQALATATSAGATVECLFMLANAAGSKKDVLLDALKRRIQHQAEANLPKTVDVATRHGATMRCLTTLTNTSGTRKDELLGALKMHIQHEAEAKAAPALLGENDVLRAKPQQAILHADEIFYANDGITPEGYAYQGKRVTTKEFKLTKLDLPKTVEEFHALVKSNWGMAVEFTIKFTSEIDDLYILNHKFIKLLDLDPTHIPNLLLKLQNGNTFTYAIDQLELILDKKTFFANVFSRFEIRERQPYLFFTACQTFEPAYDQKSRGVSLRIILMSLLCAIKNENGNRLKEILEKISLENLSTLHSLPDSLKGLLWKQLKDKNKWLWQFNIFIYFKLLITLFPEQSKAMLTKPEKRSRAFTKIIKEIRQASPADIQFAQAHFNQPMEAEQIEKELASKQSNKAKVKKPRISIVAAALAAAPAAAQPKPSAPAATAAATAAPTQKPKKAKPASSIESDPPAASAAPTAPKAKLSKSELIVQITTLHDSITKQITNTKQRLNTWESNKQRGKLEEEIEKIEKYLADNSLAKLKTLEEDKLFWKSLDMEGHEKNLNKGIEKQVEKTKPDEQPAAAAAVPKKARPKTRAEALAEKRAEQVAAKKTHNEEREKAKKAQESEEKEEKDTAVSAPPKKGEDRKPAHYSKNHAAFFKSATDDRNDTWRLARPLYAAFDYVEDMAICRIQFGNELERAIPIEDRGLYIAIRHFALQRHLFGCNNAQTRYSSKEILEDNRNLMVYAPWLHVEPQEMNANIKAVLSTTEEFISKLPKQLAKEREPNVTRTLIAPDRIKAYLSSFGFETVRETWADAPYPLVLDKTSLYLLNDHYHDKKMQKPDSKKDTIKAYNAIYDVYIPLINKISAAIKKSSDQNPNVIKQYFYFHLDALEMLLFICGQLGRILKNYPGEWRRHDKNDYMLNFINNSLEWGSTRGTVSHRYARSELSTLFAGCALAAKVNNGAESDCSLFKEEEAPKSSPKPR